MAAGGGGCGGFFHNQPPPQQQPDLNLAEDEERTRFIPAFSDGGESGRTATGAAASPGVRGGVLDTANIGSRRGRGPLNGRPPISFVYQKDQVKEMISILHCCCRTNADTFFVTAQNTNPMSRATDSLKRKRRQSILDKHYSTWHDKYASVDRFFLYCTPFLFLVSRQSNYVTSFVRAGLPEHK